MSPLMTSTMLGSPVSVVPPMIFDWLSSTGAPMHPATARQRTKKRISTPGAPGRGDYHVSTSDDPAVEEGFHVAVPAVGLVDHRTMSRLAVDEEARVRNGAPQPARGGD